MSEKPWELERGPFQCRCGTQLLIASDRNSVTGFGGTTFFDPETGDQIWQCPHCDRKLEVNSTEEALKLLFRPPQ